MDHKIVSIIIPCYNDAPFIEQAVASALGQTYPNKEVIVVDDGSNAETKAVLKKLEPKITRLITQKNHGQSTARNVGIGSASGAYIVTLDSDDYFEPSFCEKAISLMDASKEIKLVTCYATLIHDNGSTQVFKPKGGTIKDFLFANQALGTSFFRKEDWRICGGYDETMRRGFEDWEFFIRLLEKGGDTAVVGEALYNYRKRETSTTSKANKIKTELLNYIYIKHSDLYKDNFELFIGHVLRVLENEEREKLKNLERPEYKLGYALMKPMRVIKRIFKK
jgi:glycosyltransferase involved in cell wall biosynthesis